MDHYPKVKPIAFYSRKMTDDQQWYKVIEIELLSIVKSLKEFRTILLWLEVKNIY